MSVGSTLSTMISEGGTGIRNPPDSVVTQYVADLEKTPFFAGRETRGSLASMIVYYESRTPRKRSFFRTSGVLVILLSAALPVVASFGNTFLGSDGTAIAYKNLAVSIMATAIAVLTGLNAFFHWDATWRGYTQAMFELYEIRAEWEARKAEALLESNPDHALGMLREAQRRAIAGAYDVAKSEIKEYFTRQSFPKSKNV